MTFPSDLSARDIALLQSVAEHLRQYRMEAEEQINYMPESLKSGVLTGIEMAKNEVWRLAGSRPF